MVEAWCVFWEHDSKPHGGLDKLHGRAIVTMEMDVLNSLLPPRS
jgi:hypothetical protein